jgi:hypothetical protein
VARRANEFLVYYSEAMGELVAALEAHERARIELLQTAADRIIVYETSQEMNNRYDAKVFAKIVETISTDSQIAFFKSKVSLMKVCPSYLHNLPLSSLKACPTSKSRR